MYLPIREALEGVYARQYHPLSKYALHHNIYNTTNRPSGGYSVSKVGNSVDSKKRKQFLKVEAIWKLYRKE